MARRDRTFETPGWLVLGALVAAFAGCTDEGADDDATPADDDSTPVADDDSTPADDDTTPADDDTTPADDDTTPAAVDNDHDGWTDHEGDCDDGDADRFPGLAEWCDGKDNDCDPMTDEAVDADGDGYSVCDGDCDDGEPLLNAADADGDGFSTCTLDCDDSDVSAAPDASESQRTSGFLKWCTPLFEPTHGWDEDFLVQASVVYDGEYKMYYRGGYASANQMVGLATSADGVTWTAYAGNPVFDYTDKTWEKDGISAPWIVHDTLDATAPYKMYYHAREDDGSRSIGLALSTDGVVWTRFGTAPIVPHGAAGEFDERNAHAPTVVAGGVGRWHMWYSGKTLDDVYSIAYAHSDDLGYTWTKSESNPVFEAGEAGAWDSVRVTHPTILPRGSGYQFWYAGGPGPDAVDPEDTDFHSIGYGTSPDLTSWERWPDNPVLSPGAEGRWDDEEIWGASVYDVGDRYFMYYAATREEDEADQYARIGFAESRRPDAEILGPADGDVLPSGEAPWLAGWVMDDYVDDTVATWASDLDGALGTANPDERGRVFLQAATPLTDGMHTLTLHVVDASGLDRTAAVSVRVGDDG